MSRTNVNASTLLDLCRTAYTLRDGCFILGWLNIFIHLLWSSVLLYAFLLEKTTKMNSDALTYNVNVNIYATFLISSGVALALMNILLLVGTYMRKIGFLEVYVSGYTIFIVYAIVGATTEILKTNATMTVEITINIVGTISLMALAVIVARIYKERLKRKTSIDQRSTLSTRYDNVMNSDNEYVRY